MDLTRKKLEKMSVKQLEKLHSELKVELDKEEKERSEEKEE
jgi:hypothetical protein